MKYGSGSVTHMLGAITLCGTLSPNRAAISCPQAPRRHAFSRAHRGGHRGPHEKMRAVVAILDHLRVLADVGAGRSGGAGEGGRDKSRVCLTVIGAERASDRSIAEKGIARTKVIATEEFKRKPERLDGLAISFELGHVGVGACELDVAARRELAVAADNLGETAPHFT